MATPSKFGAIGFDLGLVGRIIRLLLGTAMVAGIFRDLATSNPPAMFLAEAVAYFVFSLAVCTTTFYVLSDRILARMNPWVGTAILLAPVLVVLVFDLGPLSFQIGINGYVGASLIVASLMRYGGCEVVAVPTLWFGISASSTAHTTSLMWSRRRCWTGARVRNGIDDAEPASAHFRGAAVDGAWRAEHHPEAGFRLAIDEALQVGRAFFGPSLAGLEVGS